MVQEVLAQTPTLLQEVLANPPYSAIQEWLAPYRYNLNRGGMPWGSSDRQRTRKGIEDVETKTKPKATLENLGHPDWHKRLVACHARCRGDRTGANPRAVVR